jgi:hypothetical protein
MSLWREPPAGRSLLLISLCCAAGPLLLRGFLYMDLGSLETLLFGVSARGSSGALGLWPGVLLSSLGDGLAGLRENFFLLLACFGQPAQVYLHLAEVESQWFNPIAAVLGVALVLWPIVALLNAAMRGAILTAPTRTLVLLLATATGAATLVPQGGAMIAVAVALLPPFVILTRLEIARRSSKGWLPPLLSWGYMLAVVIDLGVGWWLVGQI